MKKVKLSLMILLLLLISCNLTVKGLETSELNLESAVKIVLKKNIDLKKSSLNLEKAKLEYQQNIASNLLQKSNYSKTQAEYQLRLARSNYRKTKYKVVINTIEQYTNLWLSKLDLQIKKKQVKLQEQLLSEAKSQYEIGDIGSIDLLERENAYKDAEFNLENARYDYQHNITIFKTNLGLDEDPLIKSLKEPNIWLLTEKEVLTTALDNSVNLQLKKEEIELARMNLDRARVSSPELDKKIKEISLKIFQVEEEKIKKEIITSTKTVYYQFKQVIKNLDLKKQRLKEDQKKYQLYQQQYEKGLIKKTDILQYEINKLESKMQYKSAISNYYLNKQSLKQTMNFEAGVDISDDTEKE